MNDTVVIDLDDHRTGNTPVLSGRQRGKEVRRSTRLDSEDESAQKIVVRVPDDVYLVASSFFLGMLGPSVRKLGETGFLERFDFEGPINEAVIKDVVREVIRRNRTLQPS